MKKLLIPNIWKSFFPFRLSSEPWETPIIKIKNKQINGEIVKYVILKDIIEKILQSKKNIKEWFKFIFLIWLFISFYD